MAGYHGRSCYQDVLGPPCVGAPVVRKTLNAGFVFKYEASEPAEGSCNEPLNDSRSWESRGFHGSSTQTKDFVMRRVETRPCKVAPDMQSVLTLAS